MKHVNEIIAKVSGPPRIEFDPSVAAVYLRFKNTKIVKTLEDEGGGSIIVTIDVDAHNEVVGIELLGVKEFRIGLLRNLTRVDTSGVDLNQASFVTGKKAVAA